MDAKLEGSSTDRRANEIVWQKFSVPFEYPVAFTRGLFDLGNPLFLDILRLRETDKKHRVLIFVDRGVAESMSTLCDQIPTYCAAHPDRIDLVAPPVLCAGGEAVKSELTHIEMFQDTIHQHKIDRHSYVAAIGGGAVLDAVGLAAATAHRGVRHIRVPTTVLAQNDSGVGVKNAVNMKGIKNYTGTFAPPWAVLNDFAFLDDLPRRDRIAGLAEAAKVSLIRDGEFFSWLEAHVYELASFEAAAEQEMIRRCAALHMRQIAHGGDPFENGSARPLDFGHWSAHKLEALTHHHVRHGEAVAIGIALDSRYSVLAGLLPEGADERIAVFLETLGFRIWHPALRRQDSDGRLAILTGLEEFREHLGGELTITLPGDIGVGVEVHEMNPDLVLQSMNWLEARERA